MKKRSGLAHFYYFTLYSKISFVGGPRPHDVLGEALVLALVVVRHVRDDQVTLAVDENPEI